MIVIDSFRRLLTIKNMNSAGGVWMDDSVGQCSSPGFGSVLRSVRDSDRPSKTSQRASVYTQNNTHWKPSSAESMAMIS